MDESTVASRPAVRQPDPENGLPPEVRSADYRRRPIGVFDSGLGGLTVVKELVDRLPHESILYFGDTARVPYGTKSPETICRFSREAGHFLLGRGVKMIVVACNTASAYALNDLASKAAVPVLGVVAAGARAAHRASESGRIGVIGTTGTIASGAYERAVRTLRPAAARLIAQDYLAPLCALGIDTLVLGCTHYPALRQLIGEVMGPGVCLIDSAEETALDVAEVLQEHDLLAPRSQRPVRVFSVSDLPLRFRHVGRLLIGDMIDAVERVEVEGNLSATV